MLVLVRAGMTPVPATLIGALAGSLFNYLLQFHWTFKGHGVHRTAVPAYVGTVFLGWLVNAVLVWLFTSVAHAGVALAQLIATGAVAIMNFIAYQKVVFHERIG